MRRAQAQQRTIELTVMGVLLIGTGVAFGIVLNQNRCYRRYRRLCHQWFAGDPEGELDCLTRAEDVCFG
jgi:hypothetical protein